MTRRLISALLILFSGLAVAQQTADHRAPAVPASVSNQLIVKPAGGLKALAPGDFRALGLEIVRELPFIAAVVVRVAPGEDALAILGALKQSPLFEYAEPDFYLYASTVPNDRLYTSMCWPKPIEAERAWDVRTDSGEVIVAVVDTGVDYRHEDLARNMWRNPGESINGVDDDANGLIDDIHGARWVSGVASPDPMDDHSHGTHVAGTIGSVGNNSMGVAGAAWRTRLMALKFLSETGSGRTSDAISALAYAADKGAHVVNASWSGLAFSRPLYDAIDALRRKEILLVAAAGNDGVNNDSTPYPHYPATYDLTNVIAVAATGCDRKLAGFSAFGSRSVDLGAPGVAILSTEPNGQFGTKSGTSMATPLVTATFALVKAKNPAAAHTALRQKVLSSVDPEPSLAGKCSAGGVLNLNKALR